MDKPKKNLRATKKQTFGHICEVHSKEDSGRKSKLQTCPGTCIKAFGHMSEVYSQEDSGRKASLKNALVLVCKHWGTDVKFVVRKVLEDKHASNMPWCLYTSIWAHM